MNTIITKPLVWFRYWRSQKLFRCADNRSGFALRALPGSSIGPYHNQTFGLVPILAIAEVIPLRG
jgi:hypothetical protein